MFGVKLLLGSPLAFARRQEGFCLDMLSSVLVMDESHKTLDSADLGRRREFCRSVHIHRGSFERGLVGVAGCKILLFGKQIIQDLSGGPLDNRERVNEGSLSQDSRAEASAGRGHLPEVWRVKRSGVQEKRN